MPQFSDSLVDSVAKVVLGIMRRSDAVDYRALYGATIIFSDGQRATVKPDIAGLGQSLSDCRVRRPDGYSAMPTPGTACLLGWEGGDPSRRYVLLGALDGTAVSVKIDASTTLDLLGLLVNAGTSPATGFVATQAFVVAVNAMFAIVAAYAAAVAVVLPVTAPAAAGVTTAYAAFTGLLSTYQTTRFKAT